MGGGGGRAGAASDSPLWVCPCEVCIVTTVLYMTKNRQTDTSHKSRRYASHEALLFQLLEAEPGEGPSCHSSGQRVLFLFLFFVLFFFPSHRFVCVGAVYRELQLGKERLARRDLKTQNPLICLAETFKCF